MYVSRSRADHYHTMWFFLVCEGLAQQQFVLAAAERVFEERRRVEVDVRVRALRLTRAAAVEIPNGTVYKTKQTHA